MPYFGIPIRNGLPIGLGSVAGFGVQQFSPADLFSAGEQGAWYDPSDFSTLFTDSAGTTPVTAVEQFVGLMLDKSKGLVLGSELVTNGSFDTDTVWSKGSGYAITGGQLVLTSAPNGSLTFQSFSVGYYEVTIDIASISAGGIQLLLNNSGGDSQVFTSSGVYKFIYNSTAGGQLIGVRAIGTTTGAVNSISAKRITGNHATQTTSAKRPKLAARYNLLTYTEQFDNGAWTKNAVTAVNTTATTDPLGGTTADLLYPSSTGTFRWAYQVASTGINLFAWSIYAKAQNKSIIYTDPAGSGTALTYFNLATGQVGTVAAGYTASMSAVGNGWYRCTLTNNSASTFNFLSVWGVADANGSTTATANGTDGIFVWGADLRPASQATGLIGPTYQRVVDAATYDAVGFLPYLQFDGIDDSMSTGSIDATAVDKAQVFAGARKQADSVQQIIVEQSAAWSANNGAFVLQGVSTNQQWGVRGTANNARNYGSYTAPITQVLAAQLTTTAANSSAAIAARINGSDVVGVNDATAISTGNFGNHSLFIGARNNAGSYFNGWLSSLIVRFGATLSQSQIEATESWVNQKTGAF
jgi:hypothetical protein